MKTPKFTTKCEVCGHIADEFPAEWHEDQQRRYCHCPVCGETEKIELLISGRGRHPSTIPADAMDQLMKQMPGGWFFPRKISKGTT